MSAFVFIPTPNGAADVYWVGDSEDCDCTVEDDQ